MSQHKAEAKGGHLGFLFKTKSNYTDTYRKEVRNVKPITGHDSHFELWIALKSKNISFIFENTSDLMCSSKKCPGQPEVRAAIFDTSS